MELSIISPALNESKNIRSFVSLIIEQCKKNKIKAEVIIIDDDSKDNSKNILKQMSLEYKNFRYFIRKTKPRDLTQSCFLGIEKSKYRNVLIMDTDLQHDPKDLNKLIHAFRTGRYDVVAGCRNLFIKNKGLSPVRQLASIIIIFTTNLLLSKKTSDPMTGFFIFKKSIYKKNNSYFGKGFKILMDLIYSSKNQLKIKDVYIDFKLRKYNKSKMNFKILIYIIQFIIIKFFKRFV